ncbi:MAG: hypothetical protein ACFFC7_14400 [Candidatus Hermodarchaeota archaeon]
MFTIELYLWVKSRINGLAVGVTGTTGGDIFDTHQKILNNYSGEFYDYIGQYQ